LTCQSNCYTRKERVLEVDPLSSPTSIAEVVPDIKKQATLKKKKGKKKQEEEEEEEVKIELPVEIN
jgi:hypothetical protein